MYRVQLGMVRFSASIGYVSPVNGSNCQSALSAIHQITMWEDARKLREYTFIAVFGCDAQEGSLTSLIRAHILITGITITSLMELI